MIQQFSHTLLKSQSSFTQQDIALIIAQLFGRKIFIARNII